MPSRQFLVQQAVLNALNRETMKAALQGAAGGYLWPSEVSAVRVEFNRLARMFK